ncbi:hypothetical protein ABPG77_004701 [Micractinium sp. CCAP 211/92]
MEVLRSSLGFLPRTALVAGGRSYRYADVLSSAVATCRKLESGAAVQPGGAAAGAVTMDNGPRVALMADPGPAYVAGAFGTWMHGGIAVPLCLSHPDRELQYVLEDAEVSSVLASEEHADRLAALAQPFGAEVHVVEAQPQQAAEGQAEELQREVGRRLMGRGSGEGALIIYTSGTTGRPKGALHTHASLAAQVDTLCAAWAWEPADRILHCLPLHHVHGIVNALLCPLSTGACAEMLPKFSPREVWQHLQREEEPVTVFMGVPTMYSHLLTWRDRHMDPQQQAAAAAAARRLRLTVSGSAACPGPIMQRWEELSGSKLLERYGMTETGMLLGNPYAGERRPETVGQPFPGVHVRLANADGSDAGAGPGELRVKGPQLFKEYWKRPEATAEAFDDQGYFLTGDTGIVQDGYYKLLGRTSVDIIKHGGYKISALHIESALLEHPLLSEVAVLGLPDEVYGERIAAVVALKNGGDLTLQQLRAFASASLPAYQLPAELVVVPAIPRNAMGKVNKKELRQQLFPSG